MAIWGEDEEEEYVCCGMMVHLRHISWWDRWIWIHWLALLWINVHFYRGLGGEEIPTLLLPLLGIDGTPSRGVGYL